MRVIASVSPLDSQIVSTGLAEASKSQHDDLRLAALDVLSLIPGAYAQGAIADIAFSDSESEEMRLAAFVALSSSARRYGNTLGEERVQRLGVIAFDEPDLTLRTAAGKALGALNLTAANVGDVVLRYRSR